MSNINMEEEDDVEIYERVEAQHKWWMVDTYYVNTHYIKFVVPRGYITPISHRDNWMVGPTDPIHNGT